MEAIVNAEASSIALRPPRILMVCARYLPDLGGLETHVYEITRRLTQISDFEITILATDLTRKLPAKDIINGITVLRVPSWPQNRDYYLSPKVAIVAGQRDRWDLVHCQGIHNAVPILAMTAARYSGIPYMATFHTGGHSNRLRASLRSAQWRVIGPLLRSASALVAVSRFEADTISRQARLSAARVTVIRNGGTLPAPPAGSSSVPGRIVSSGRLERYKGHHHVIEALPHVIREMPEAHVVILGSGPYKMELLRLADRVGVTDRVSIVSIPPTDRLAMAQALAESSVVAALSEYEAHPVGVMEALSVGRPVVGYDVTGIGELVNEGWVRGVSPRATSATVARKLLDAMSSPCQVMPTDLPTWDASAMRLADLYSSVLGQVGVSRSLLGPSSSDGAVIDLCAVT